jgi:hypothetical protein
MHSHDQLGERDVEGTKPVPPAPPYSGSERSPSSKQLLLLFLNQLKTWLRGLTIPNEITLAALLLAAFLLFPAYKGLRSGSIVQQLEQTNQELQQKLNGAVSRTIQLERSLSERDIQLTQRRQQTRVETGSGLYVSPLLSLEPKKSSAPDLISIDFTQADQAILVFSLPRTELQEIEISVYQDTRLAWSHRITIPQQKLFNENLVTMLLTRSALGGGTYQMTVEGNPGGQRVKLNNFDLSITS